MDTAEANVRRSKETNRSQLWARIVIGLLLALSSAVGLTMAFPPHDLWPLIWVGFIPMLVAQYRVLPKGVSSLAPAIAIGGWLGGYMVPIFGGSGSYMVALPLVIGAITLLTDKGSRAFHERTGYRWFVLHGPVSHVGVEMIRSFVPIMGTWAFVAYTLYAQPWLIQPVSIFGIFGLGLVILLVNYALGQAALALFDRRWQLDPGLPVLGTRLVLRWLAIVGVVLAVWTGLSLALFRTPTTPSVRVAAIQVPGRTEDNWGYVLDPGRRALLSQWLHGQTREAARDGARIIVWPEGALNYDPQVEHTAELQALSAETQAYLVAGYMVTLPGGGWRNEATVLAPDGEFLGVFGKDHPVVFGGERGTSLGIYPVYDTPPGKFGTIICYDLDFIDTARKVTRSGAQLIAVSSLDWPGIATKHYSHVVFRAVENRVAMVKADGGYDSAIIDPYGRIVDLVVSPEGSRATLVADVPLGTGDALAVRWGDWVGWACLAGLVFFSVPNPLINPRKKRA